MYPPTPKGKNIHGHTIIYSYTWVTFTLNIKCKVLNDTLRKERKKSNTLVQRCKVQFIKQKQKKHCRAILLYMGTTCFGHTQVFSWLWPRKCLGENCWPVREYVKPHSLTCATTSVPSPPLITTLFMITLST